MADPIEALGAPASEFNEGFIQKMRARMAVSYHKYGRMAEADGVDMIASIDVRVQKYLATGNTEWLIDAANCCLIEFTHPRVEGAHFRATDSDESPGRVVANRFSGAPQLSRAHNLDV